MKIQITISLPPDREGFVAELWENEQHFGEVFISEAGSIIEIYPRQDGKPWRFCVDEIQQTLDAACKKLSGA